ncbi:MAG: hypothetical protein ACRC92_26475 [Peptostreptococcaceae bacterium]
MAFKPYIKDTSRNSMFLKLCKIGKIRTKNVVERSSGSLVSASGKVIFIIIDNGKVRKETF